jgi:predicted amidohydrolase YtcJ
MAFQGEYFIDRYGKKAAERTPPVARMLEMGVPVGAGTDATRVASYNPFVSLYWLVTGKTVGGTELYPQANRLDRATALRLYTAGSSWFSSEQDQKGSIEAGKLADLALLSADYFTIPDEEIRNLESVLTVVGGNVVYAAAEFSKLDPPSLPASPDWSRVKTYGGYAAQPAVHVHSHSQHAWTGLPGGLLCGCWAF